MELPLKFKTAMEGLLGKDYDDFIKSYDDSPRQAIRINTSKISADEFEKRAPFDIEKIPFVSNGYYIKETEKWAKHPFYHAGLYYFQEPSAMYASTLLPIRPHDLVLDLCAAPGGKSTYLAASNIGLLVSNDISISRTIPLVKNLEHFGTCNHTVTCEAPSKLEKIWPERFDAILADAPCSGEGMFRRDRDLIKAYMQKGPDCYAEVQKSILESAYKMLRPQGYLLYLTCTFSDIEDERVIIGFLEEHNDMCICPIDKKYGLCGPYDIYKYNGDIAGTAHAFPHRFSGEGHFMALMKKSGEPLPETDMVHSEFRDIDILPDDAASFLDCFSDDHRKRFKTRKFLKGNDGSIYMLPDLFEKVYDKRIRYARTGTLFGRVNSSGKFSPHTAFALTLKADDFNNVISYDAGDDNVLRYLKGETIIIDKDRAGKVPDKGPVLVCVDSFPLGFAKYDGIRLKNLYEKGWIYR